MGCARANSSGWEFNSIGCVRTGGAANFLAHRRKGKANMHFFPAHRPELVVLVCTGSAANFLTHQKGKTKLHLCTH
eukprot:1490590-Amphidinium_carterae.1